MIGSFTVKRLFVIMFYVCLALGFWKLTGFPDFPGAVHGIMKPTDPITFAAAGTATIMFVVAVIIAGVAIIMVFFTILFWLGWLWAWSAEKPMSFDKYKRVWMGCPFIIGVHT